MTAIDQLTIGEYVASDFRIASVFSKHNIDFCCKGNRTLDEACQAKGLDKNQIENEINTILNSKNENGIDFKSWPLDLLIDYIEKTHHRYIEEKTPIILQFLDKLCKVHGDRHPELLEINILFKIGAGALAQHMKKEELILLFRWFYYKIENFFSISIALGKRILFSKCMCLCKSCSNSCNIENVTL